MMSHPSTCAFSIPKDTNINTLKGCDIDNSKREQTSTRMAINPATKHSARTEGIWSSRCQMPFPWGKNVRERENRTECVELAWQYEKDDDPGSGSSGH